MPEPSTQPASAPADTVDDPTAEAVAVAADPVSPVDASDTSVRPTAERSAADEQPTPPAADPQVTEPAAAEEQPAATADAEVSPASVALEQTAGSSDDEPDEFVDETGGPFAAASAALAHRRTLIMAVLAIVVLAVDQISKSLVVAKLTGHDPVKVAGGAVYLLEVTNKGAAFSLGEGYTALFTAVAAAVVVVMVRVSSRLSSTGWAVALGLILGGAAGNLTDRLFRAPGPLRGAVVDWISLFDPEGRIWPVFNLADSAIVCGGVCAVILMLLGRDLTVQSRRD